MKIGVAQIRPVIGDVKANLESHKALVKLAAAEGARVVIFPELSITGYEPKIASDVATTLDDMRFSELQKLSNEHNIVIGAGMPIKNEKAITITMILFYPNQTRGSYSKKFLHEDEEPFFVSGANFPSFIVGDTRIALAICYEISVPEHAQGAAATNPVIYIASVAKFKRHMEKTIETLRDTAKKHSMMVMLSNCLGVCDGEECVGSSFAVNKRGEMIGQLDDVREGVLVLDLDTEETAKKYA
jgi:predicted amidohydrolase